MGLSLKKLISLTVICLSSLSLKPAMAFDFNNYQMVPGIVDGMPFDFNKAEKYTSCYHVEDMIYVANGKWYFIDPLSGRNIPTKVIYGGHIMKLGYGIMQVKYEDAHRLPAIGCESRIYIKSDLLTGSCGRYR